MPSDYRKIRNDNIRRRGEEFDDIGRLISEQLYGDRSHFVYELLQNAEDAMERRFRQDPLGGLPVSVQFRLYKDRLEFRHFGQLFDEEDVRAISDVLKGTKGEDKAQIGKFGIGFKSVYAFTSTPEIHSGEEHFIIERYIRPREADRIPEVKDKETLFVFPFNHEKVSPDEAYNLIAKKLKLIGSRVLLFLKQINEIKWYIEGNESGHYLREQKTHGGGKHVTVIGQTIGKKEKEEEEDWLVFERPVLVENIEDTVSVEVAFRLEFDAKTQENKIIKVTSSPLVAYFSTEKETGLGFIIQGPYRTTPSRDNIQIDFEWNKKLVKETATLIIDSLIKLKNMGLLTVSVLETLPIKKHQLAMWGMLQPIVDSVHLALMELALWPTDDGTFAFAKNVKLARGSELRKLLPQDKLKEFLSDSKELRWLSSEITRERTPDLRSYLMNELNVEEISREVFARKLSASFLENQSDGWIISFYEYLSKREALWKKYKWNSPGVLRNKPIIRLNNGIHVIPFREDGSPNAFLPIEEETDFPIVKVEIVNNESAYDFLKKLGIPDHDLVDEVLVKILPKYEHGAKINLEEHNSDIEKIQRAYQTDSNEKKHRLSKKLIETPFIYAENIALNLESYKRPVELYFSNQDLLMYFEGNKDIWFVSSEYDDNFMRIIKNLGVSEAVRVKCKKENRQGYVVIVNSHGWHKRGYNGFDPDIEVDSLEHAIEHPTMEKSLFIWNNLAIPHSNCISGIIESSGRQTYEYSKTNQETSEFGHLLRNSAWLPGTDDKFHKPGELSLDDLSESFRPDEKLSKQLGMKKDVMATLAIEAGVSQTTISLAQKLERQPQDIRKKIESMLQKESSQPEFPQKTSANHERRQEKIIKKYRDAPKKRYEKIKRSTRTTENIIDPQNWLRENYTNDNGEMICQICEKTMPFKKKNGQYYFEAVEILNHLNKELEELHLALCPLCAAMYKELIKRDKNAMACLKEDLMATEDPELPIKLGDREASLRFVERHFDDLKVILRESGDHVE